MATGNVTAGRLRAVLCMAAALAGGTAGAQSPDFKLANNTPFTVYYVHFWPTSGGIEGPDRLGEDIIPSGATYSFEPRDGGCMYNLRITLEERNYKEQWSNINLCELYTLTLNYNHLNKDLSLSKR